MGVIRVDRVDGQSLYLILGQARGRGPRLGHDNVPCEKTAIRPRCHDVKRSKAFMAALTG